MRDVYIWGCKVGCKQNVLLRGSRRWISEEQVEGGLAYKIYICICIESGRLVCGHNVFEGEGDVCVCCDVMCSMCG